MVNIFAKAEASPKPRSTPLLPPRFVQAMLAGHSALGLAFAALIYLVCLTGTISVFKKEIERWEQPNAPLVTQPLSASAIQEAVWSGYGQALIDSASQTLSLLAPGPLGSRFAVSYFDPRTGNSGEWIADSDGRLVTRVNAPVSEFVEDLHTKLHLPEKWGRFIVALTGVALLSSLISGVLSHPRLFKDAFILRLGGSKRLQNADLHNRLAVWGLPFHLLVALTGSLLGLSILIIGVLATAAYGGKTDQAYAAILGPRATSNQDAGPVPDIAAMILAVQHLRPTAVFVGAQIERPGTGGEIIRLNMRTPGHLAFGNMYFFDGKGKPLGDAGFETGSVGQQILGALQPVHYGWFGGIGTKLIYGVIGLALTIVTQSGVATWLARRRGKGRAAASVERLWETVTWGIPFALGTTALWSLHMGENYQREVFVVGLGLACLIGFLSAKSTVSGGLLQIAAASTLALSVINHDWIWWEKLSDPMAIAVSVILLGLSLLVSAKPLIQFGRRFAL